MKCPKCLKENLIVDTNKDITYYLCIECGYRSNTNFNVKSFEFQSTLTFLNADLKKMVWKDVKTGLYWFPVEFNIPKVGILYPEGDLDNISWVYMPMLELDDVMKKKYPGKKEIPDETQKKIIQKENLKQALRLLKIID